MDAVGRKHPLISRDSKLSEFSLAHSIQQTCAYEQPTEKQSSRHDGAEIVDSRTIVRLPQLYGRQGQARVRKDETPPSIVWRQLPTPQGDRDRRQREEPECEQPEECPRNDGDNVNGGSRGFGRFAQERIREPSRS